MAYTGLRPIDMTQIETFGGVHERHIRSLVKGVTWRVLGTLDTFLLALIYTRSLRAALSIGGIELVTKVVWYYCHERFWIWLRKSNKRRLFRSVHVHSVLKAVSWRFIGAVDTMLIALIVTGQLGISLAISATEFFTKIILYYLHERTWHQVTWGYELNGASDPTQSIPAAVFPKNHWSRAALYAVLTFSAVFICSGVVYLLH